MSVYDMSVAAYKTVVVKADSEKEARKKAAEKAKKLDKGDFNEGNIEVVEVRS